MIDYIDLTSGSVLQNREIYEGQRLYSRLFLKIYDRVFKLIVETIYGASVNTILKMYKLHASSNHLEIGVGSGMLPALAEFPGNSNLTLMDINPNTFTITKERVKFKFTTIQCYRINILEEIKLEKKYQSIAMHFLIHCVPGSILEKRIIFENAIHLLEKGGTLFGSTVVYEVSLLNSFSKFIMLLLNKKGIYHNREDSLADLKEVLSSFKNTTHTFHIEGPVVFFSIKKTKQSE